MIACQMTEPSQSLAGRTMFVTGASSGIGKAIALAAARAGADVAFTYRTNETGARDVQQAITVLGRRAAVIRLDVSNDASLRALGPAVRAALGRVDAWVNNAGADILTGPAAPMTESQRLDLLMAVDLRGTIHDSWSATEVLAEQEAGGVIINMSWDHVLSGMAGTDPQMFAAVKGGVLAFSKSLARSLAPRVRVNVIAPGWIETSFGEGLDAQRHRQIAEATPLERWGTPDDVAGAAIFLASPAAAFITGQAILVGGGVVM